MTTKSKVAPATPKERSRNKTNSSARSKVIRLLPSKTCADVQAQTRRDFENFLKTSTNAEKIKAINHLLNKKIRQEDLMVEIRQSLGKNTSKCKVIQFPVVSKRLASKEAQ